MVSRQSQSLKDDFHYKTFVCSEEMQNNSPNTTIKINGLDIQQLAL
jgi:hypothetical protein